MLGIRVASSMGSGRGHIARCQAIRAHINGPVTWFIDAGGALEFAHDAVQLEPEIDSVDYVQAEVNAGRIRGVLLDSYHLDTESIVRLSASVSCLALCDFPPFPKVHRLVVPQATQESQGNIYGGLAYQVVSPNLAVHRGRTESEPNGPLRILVAFGARDSANRTGLVLSALDALQDRRQFSVTCVLGRDAPHLDAIRTYLANRTEVTLLTDIDEMGPVYVCHDLAIGAPGVSQGERAYCGVPSLLVAQNEAQVSLCQAWGDLKAAMVATPDKDHIAAGIDALLESRLLRRDIRAKAMALVDGRGAQRIADLIHEIMG